MDFNKRNTNTSVLDYYTHIADRGNMSEPSSPDSNYSSEANNDSNRNQFNDTDNDNDRHNNNNRQMSIIEKGNDDSHNLDDKAHLNVFAPSESYPQSQSQSASSSKLQMPHGPVKIGSYDYEPPSENEESQNQSLSIGQIPQDILLKRRKSNISLDKISTAAIDPSDNNFNHSPLIQDNDSHSFNSSDTENFNVISQSPTLGTDPLTITKDMPLPNCWSSKATLNGALTSSDRAMRTAEAINLLAKAASGMKVWLTCVGGEGKSKGSWSPPPLLKHSERYINHHKNLINSNSNTLPPKSLSLKSLNSIAPSDKAQGSSSPYMATPIVPYSQQRQNSNSVLSITTNSTFPLRPGGDVDIAHDLTNAHKNISDSPPDKPPTNIPYPGALKKTSSTNTSASIYKTGKASRAAGFFANLGRRTSAKSPPKKLQIGNPSPLSKTSDLPSALTPPSLPPRPLTATSNTSSSPTNSNYEPPTAPPTVTSFDNKSRNVQVPARNSSYRTSKTASRHIPSASTSNINLEGLQRGPSGPRSKPKSRNSSIFGLSSVMSPNNVEPFPGLHNLQPPSQFKSKLDLRASTPAPARGSSKQQSSSKDEDPAFKASLNRLENLLPQASKADLKYHLKKGEQTYL